MKKFGLLILAVSLSFNAFATNSNAEDAYSSEKNPIIKKVEKSSVISYKKSKMLNHFVPAVKLENSALSTRSSLVPSICQETIGNYTFTVFESQGQIFVTQTDNRTNRTRRVRDNISIIEAADWCDLLSDFAQ